MASFSETRDKYISQNYCQENIACQGKLSLKNNKIKQAIAFPRCTTTFFCRVWDTNETREIAKRAYVRVRYSTSRASFYSPSFASRRRVLSYSFS